MGFLVRAGGKMVFGQIVIGPPGSGKTTYCDGMSQFLRLIGRCAPGRSLPRAAVRMIVF